MSGQIRIKLTLSFGKRKGCSRLHSKPKQFSDLIQSIDAFLITDYEQFDYDLFYLDDKDNRFDLANEAQFQQAVKMAAQFKTKTLKIVLEKNEKKLNQIQLADNACKNVNKIESQMQNQQLEKITEFPYNFLTQKSESIDVNRGEKIIKTSKKSILENLIPHLSVSNENVELEPLNEKDSNNNEIKELIESRLNGIFSKKSQQFLQLLDEFLILPQNKKNLGLN